MSGLPKLGEGKLLVENSSNNITGFCVCDWNGDGWPDLLAARDEESQQRRGSIVVYLRQ